MKFKDFLGMMKLGFTLAIFATTACIMLAFVYAGTKTIIAQRQQDDLKAALSELFPDADSFEETDELKSPDSAVAILIAYAAKKSGQTIGAALELSRASYSGPIMTMVGINTDGFITGVKILEHSDTVGFGANAASSSYFVDRERGITFYGQFAGKHVSHSFRVKDDIIAISASTITSNAVSSSVKAAALAASAWFSGEEADVVTSASEGGEK
ncbi:MAG: FMN-binding protein [Treponema sp.]|jgi:electron transport complex protein RnfG|nr:FMN-binding protein [Treponema sp.]